MKIKLIIVSLFIFLVLIILFPKQEPPILDDVTPAKSCDQLITKADIVYVIPFYENGSLANYPEWCRRMKSLNKTFGLHGLTHEYHEFLKPVDEAELQKAMGVFENCLGYTPYLFRPPYNKISKENQKKIELFNLTLYKKTFFTFPYCHCQPNPWMKLFNWLAGC